MNSVSFKADIKGQNLMPLMLGEMDGMENRVFYGVGQGSKYGRMYYVIHDGWKLIWYRGWYQGAGKLELYNLRTDPFERKNLFSPEHPIVGSLLPRLEEIAQNSRNARKEHQGSPDLPLQLKEELRTLGYIE
jgi:hypothetical protein